MGISSKVDWKTRTRIGVDNDFTNVNDKRAAVLEADGAALRITGAGLTQLAIALVAKGRSVAHCLRTVDGRSEHHFLVDQIVHSLT